MSINYTQADKLKKLRARAAELGLTFKRQYSYINNQQAYFIEDRTTGKRLVENLTISGAWDQHVEDDFLGWIAETK